jgi:hypothetical protein
MRLTEPANPYQCCTNALFKNVLKKKYLIGFSLRWQSFGEETAL